MQSNPSKAHDPSSLIQIQNHEDHVLVQLRDENPDLLKVFQCFDELIKTGSTQIVFDLDSVLFPSGSLIALLISITFQTRQQGGELYIINLRNTAHNNLSFFTPLTYLAIESETDYPAFLNRKDAFKHKELTSSTPDTLRVSAAIDSLQRITDFVTSWAEASGVDHPQRSKLKIAVHEASMNVIEHGYQFAPGKEIEIKVESDARSFRVIISDWGSPFESFGRSDYSVHDAFENQKRGGYGFYIMQQSVDEIRYEYGEGGNQLTLVIEFEEAKEKS
jgi:serine/threonine-protein kinase RsbW